MADDERARTGGLALERTALAWNRSGLALGICALVLLRHLWPLRGAGQDVALALIATAAVLWSLVLLAWAVAPVPGAVSARFRSRALRSMTVATLMLAVAAVVLAFTAPP